MRKLGNNKATVADPVPAGEVHNVLNGRAKEPKVPFWETVNSLGDKWATDGYTAYIYRKWPVIDKGESDHFIAKLREPFDPEYLLRTFGSGKYSLQLNDGHGKVVAWKVESVHHPDHPPKLNPAEVTRDPQNDSYWATWGKSDAAGKAEKEQPRDPDIAAIIRAAREGNKIEPQVIEWLQNMADRRDDLAAKLADASAKNPAGDLASLLTAVKGIMPTPPPAAPPPPQPDMAAILRLVKELQPPPPPPAPNPLELLEQAKNLFSPPTDDMAHIDRLISMADKLASIRGGGGGGRRSAWDVGLDYVRELVPLAPHLGSLGNLLGLRLPGMGGTPAPGAATAATPQQPAAFDPWAQPHLLRQHSQGVNGATAQAAAAAPALPGTAPPAAGPANGAAPPNDLLSVFRQYGALVVNALNNGTPGYDFADYVCGLLGKSTHALISAHGEPALVSTMMSVPEIALFGEPRLRAFTAEFIDFERYLNEMEEPAPEGQVGAGA